MTELPSGPWRKVSVDFARPFLNLGMALGPVVRRPVSANLGLNFNQGFFFSSKALSRILLILFFLEYPVVKL